MEKDSKEARDFKNAFDKVRVAGSTTLLLFKNLSDKDLSFSEKSHKRELERELAAVGTRIEGFANKVINGK